MFHVVLYEPEIPPNTGNAIRLCANSGCRLHLVGKLGFSLEDRLLRRAGLDYHEWAEVAVHADYAAFQAAVRPGRVFTFSTHHRRRYSDARFTPGDALMFGPETRGLPVAVRDTVPDTRRLQLPMVPASRSLNLSNAVAIAVYEAWRQQDFAGAVTG